MGNRSSIVVPVLAVLLVIILMIPITHMIIAPKEVDPLNSPIFELGNMTLIEVFETNKKSLNDYQLIVNGDFSAGTSAWNNQANSVSLSVTDGIMKTTVVALQTYTGLGQVINLSQNNKYYFYGNFKPYRSHNMVFHINGATTVPTQAVIANQWNTYSFIYSQATKVSNDFVIYDNGASNTGKDIGYQAFYDNNYITNIDLMKTNKLYSPQFDTTFDLMSDADIKTQMETWVADDLTTINIPLTFNALGLAETLTYDRQLYWYNLYLYYKSL